MQQIVGVDIGGTGARAQLYEWDGEKFVAIGSPAEVRMADVSGFPELVGALSRLLGQPLGEADAIGFAATGLFQNGIARHPKFPKGILEVATTALRLGWKRWQWTNDFMAEAAATQVLEVQSTALHICGGMHHPKPGKVSVVGPGTGLGHAALYDCSGQPFIVTTEAGHSAVPVRYLAGQGDFLRFLSLRVEHDHVDGLTVERVVSGDGLALVIEFVTGKPWNPMAPIVLTTLPEDVARIFCLYLGLQAGGYVLSSGAWDGLYLTGGVLKRNPELLTGVGLESFIRGLTSPIRHKRMLAAMPVWVMTHPQTGTLGAAANVSQLLK